ncbi:MAG: VWA domain-containing protein [Planctomycetota bacterium]|nr:VWA domain-containing protein [Planctomycetota bacterium]
MVLWTAHRISVAVSVLLHATVVCVLAGVVIAACITESGTPLDATLILEEADGGDLEFGNAEIDIDLPNNDANTLREMVASVALPVIVLPESQVALRSIAGIQSQTTEKSGGARKGDVSEGKNGTVSGAGGSNPKSAGNVTFFGEEVQANSVAFVIDASASMAGTRFRRARTELISALHKLQPDQRFFVVFYTDQTYPLFYPDNTIELIPAEQRNLGRVCNWIAQAQVQGGTEPQEAMAMALKLQPDIVFLLSDGDIPFQTQGIVRFHNRHSAVHTITFGSDVGAKIMQQIAAKNGGEYRFVPDAF